MFIPLVSGHILNPGESTPPPEPVPTATLVLNGITSAGKDNWRTNHSYVESDLGGPTIRRTFTPFPETAVETHPMFFNIHDDYVNGVEVRDGVGDDTPPDHIYGTTISGNHGWRVSIATVTAHGKTVDDRGSIWTDGTNQYLLIKESDADTLVMVRRDQLGYAPTGAYTHVSGATNTAGFTIASTTNDEWHTIFQNYSMTVKIDGVVETEKSGTFEYASKVEFIESYEILQFDSLVSWWEANASTGSISPSGTASIRLNNTYEYDRFGQMTIYREWVVLDDIPIADLMGIQSVHTSNTDKYYIPNTVPFTHETVDVDYGMGYDADWTEAAGAGSIFFDSSKVAATGPMVDRLLSLYGTSYVFAQGFLPLELAADDTARRALLTDHGMEVRGTTSKVYFRVVDKGTINATAGDSYKIVGYRNIMPKPSNQTAFYRVTTDDFDFLYMDWHDVSATDVVNVPEDMVGKSFTVVQSRNTTMSNGTLGSTLSVPVSATSDHAFLVLKVSN